MSKLVSIDGGRDREGERHKAAVEMLRDTLEAVEHNADGGHRLASVMVVVEWEEELPEISLVTADRMRALGALVMAQHALMEGDGDE